jgi:hypothetical protein
MTKAHTDDEDVHAYQMSGTRSQPQRLVIGEGDTIDDAQASGRWLSTDSPADIRR